LNRKDVPLALKEAKLEQGEQIAMQSQGVMVIKVNGQTDHVIHIHV
jgi:hypothetical protein